MVEDMPVGSADGLEFLQALRAVVVKSVAVDDGLVTRDGGDFFELCSTDVAHVVGLVGVVVPVVLHHLALLVESLVANRTLETLLLRVMDSYVLLQVTQMNRLEVALVAQNHCKSNWVPNCNVNFFPV